MANECSNNVTITGKTADMQKLYQVLIEDDECFFRSFIPDPEDQYFIGWCTDCLLYTSPSPRDRG